jgi:tRNA(Ile)-lysidine synthase
VRAAEAQTVNQTPVPLTEAALFDGLAGTASVAIAVSGGSDSMGLLRLAKTADLRGLVALTVDHGLRPESAAEAARVAQWCAEQGIEHRVLAWTGEKPRTGLQAKARKARYDLMSDYCRARGIGVLLTAHTQDDQAETVAMRQSRTDSVAALAGIWPENTWNGVRVLRPLLGVRRLALRHWLTQLGQDWIDDPSNDDPRFERVRVRQTMTDEKVVALAEHADQSRKEAVEVAQAAHVRLQPEGYFVFDRGLLCETHTSLQAGVLAELVRQVGGGHSFEASSQKRLVDGLSVEGRRTLGGALVAVRKKDVLVAREAGRIACNWVAIGQSGSVIWDRRFKVTAPPGSAVKPIGRALIIQRPKGVPGYVYTGCPMVKLPDGMLISGLNAGRSDVSAVLE